jgi:hypothetical protein
MVSDDERKGTVRGKRVPCLALALAMLCGGGLSAAAQDYTTPERGSDDRRDILNAMRPLAAWAFDPPIEFIVTDIRISGDVAYASVLAQRPGGEAIDISQSPIVQRDEEPIELIDGPVVGALLQKSGEAWVPVHHAVGPTDVWQSWTGYCEVWGPVLPEYCEAG